MDDFKVDYHIHTTYSDGQSTPTQIIKKAKELEYDVIAITDHDNMDGLDEAAIAAEAVEMNVVNGIEVAVETEDGYGLHILGYYFDKDNAEFKEWLKQLIRNREDRNELLIKTLRDMGYDIAIEELEMGKNSFIGKPIIARKLVEKGYIKTEKEAFGEKILGSSQCRAVRKRKPQASEAIAAIKAAGGTAVLAHPIQIKGIGVPGTEPFYTNVETLLRRLRKQGLRGLECYHPDQSKEQSSRFVEMADKYHLHITRGSDFHGADFAEADSTADYR